MVAMTAKFPVHAKGELSKIIFLADMSAKGGGQNPYPLLKLIFFGGGENWCNFLTSKTSICTYDKKNFLTKFYSYVKDLLGNVR